MINRCAILLISALALGQTAIAEGSIASLHVPDAAVVGKARLKIYFWKVFDATLVASRGEYEPDKPFALTLSYLRHFAGDKIVEKSISEIKSQQSIDPATLKSWETELSMIIPDVVPGNSITGVRDDRGHALFYLDEEPIGQISDPDFSTAFFNIWLGEKTSQPGLRKKLIGEAT